MVLTRITPQYVFRRLAVMAILTAGYMVAGCTHNNGDIGVWFGTWTLTSVTVDGRPGTDYAGNSTWSFQNTVIRIQESYPHNQFTDHYGTWRQQGEDFTLDFTHHDPNDTLSWSQLYKFPEHMYFDVRKGVIEMRVDRLTGNKADLSYTNRDSQTITYHLKKLY